MATKPKLTRKQAKFVEAFVETGVGAQAAKKAYDIEPTDHKLAAVMGSENLAKPYIREEIERRITKEQVEQAHSSLLSAVRLDYFVFDKKMPDEEIVAHVESVGLKCVNVRPSEKGKLAFFTLPDGMARGKGIELYHKLMGSFAPEKRVVLNVKAEPDPRIKELAKKLNK
jgi:hypothetical protein